MSLEIWRIRAAAQTEGRKTMRLTTPQLQNRLRKIANELRLEADNISPANAVHPAPTMRAWARKLDCIVKELSE